MVKCVKKGGRNGLQETRFRIQGTGGAGGNKGREDIAGIIAGIRSASKPNKPVEERGGREHGKSVRTG